MSDNDYYSSGELKKNALARMKKYNASVKGKRVRAEYRERNRERIRKYMNNYFRQRAKRLKAENRCVWCLKKKGKNSTVSFCSNCREKIKKNARNRYDNSKN